MFILWTNTELKFFGKEMLWICVVTTLFVSIKFLVQSLFELKYVYINLKMVYHW